MGGRSACKSCCSYHLAFPDSPLAGNANIFRTSRGSTPCAQSLALAARTYLRKTPLLQPTPNQSSYPQFTSFLHQRGLTIRSNGILKAGRATALRFRTSARPAFSIRLAQTLDGTKCQFIHPNYSQCSDFKTDLPAMRLLRRLLSVDQSNSRRVHQHAQAGKPLVHGVSHDSF